MPCRRYVAACVRPEFVGAAARVRAAEEMALRSAEERARGELSRVLLPLLLDLSCESAAAHFDVEGLVGAADSEGFQQASCRLVVRHVYAIVKLVGEDA